MMISEILINHSTTVSPGGYAAGAVIALLILGYLLYSLIKPEKF